MKRTERCGLRKIAALVSAIAVIASSSAFTAFAAANDDSGSITTLAAIVKSFNNYKEYN